MQRTPYVSLLTSFVFRQGDWLRSYYTHSSILLFLLEKASLLRVLWVGVDGKMDVSLWEGRYGHVFEQEL